MFDWLIVATVNHSMRNVIWNCDQDPTRRRWRTSPRMAPCPPVSRRGWPTQSLSRDMALWLLSRTADLTPSPSNLSTW